MDCEEKVEPKVEHVLLSHATRRPSHAIPCLPNRTRYDSVKGYWVREDVPFVRTDEFLESESATKKMDARDINEDMEG